MLITPVSCECLDPIVKLFAEVMRSNPSYVSHSEVMQGRSLDGVWADELESILELDLRTALNTGAVFAAYCEDSFVVGAIILEHKKDARRPYVTVADLVVSKAFGGRGIGAALLRKSEEWAREVGAFDLWLESGLHNENAHKFFEFYGFQTFSKIFRKRLDFSV